VTTSIGNLDRPHTNSEYVYVFITVLLGLMMYSMVIGSASSALANIDATGAARKKMLDSIIAYMRGRAVPRFFQRIIIDYYNFKWEQNKGDDSVMDMLPGALKDKLTMIINKDIIDRIPIFGYMSAEVYLRTVPHLQGATYLPGDFVIKQSEPGDHMYFIKSGKVDAVLPNGFTVFMTLFPGQFFGEKSLLYMKKRDASFRAVDFVDLIILDRATFTELYISAPDFIRELQKTDTLRDKARLKFELSITEKAKAEAASLSDITDAATGGDGAVSAATAADNAIKPCCPTISWLPWCTPCCGKYKACQRAGFWGKLGRKMYLRLRGCYRDVCGKAEKRFCVSQENCCFCCCKKKATQEENRHYKWKREQIEKKKSLLRLHKSGIKVKGLNAEDLAEIDDDDAYSVGASSFYSNKTEDDAGSAKSTTKESNSTAGKSPDLSKGSSAADQKPVLAAGLGAGGMQNASFFSRLAFGAAKVGPAGSAGIAVAGNTNTPSALSSVASPVPWGGGQQTGTLSTMPSDGSTGRHITNEAAAGNGGSSSEFLPFTPGGAASPPPFFKAHNQQIPKPILKTGLSNHPGGPDVGSTHALGSLKSPLLSPVVVNPAAAPATSTTVGAAAALSPNHSPGDGLSSLLAFVLPEPSTTPPREPHSQAQHPQAQHQRQHHRQHHHQQHQHHEHLAADHKKSSPQPLQPNGSIKTINLDTAISTGVNVNASSAPSSARSPRPGGTLPHTNTAEDGSGLKSRRSRQSRHAPASGPTAAAGICTTTTTAPTVVEPPPGIVKKAQHQHQHQHQHPDLPALAGLGNVGTAALPSSRTALGVPIVASARLQDNAGVPASARGVPPALPGAVPASSRAASTARSATAGIGAVVAAAGGLAAAVGSTLLAAVSARRSAEQKEQDVEEKAGLLAPVPDAGSAEDDVAGDDKDLKEVDEVGLAYNHHHTHSREPPIRVGELELASLAQPAAGSASSSSSTTSVVSANPGQTTSTAATGRRGGERPTTATFAAKKAAASANYGSIYGKPPDRLKPAGALRSPSQRLQTQRQQKDTTTTTTTTTPALPEDSLSAFARGPASSTPSPTASPAATPTREKEKEKEKERERQQTALKRAGTAMMGAAMAAAGKDRGGGDAISAGSRALEAMLQGEPSPASVSPMSGPRSDVGFGLSSAATTSTARPTTASMRGSLTNPNNHQALLSPVPEAHSVGPGGMRLNSAAANAAAGSLQDAGGFGFRSASGFQAGAGGGPVFVGRAVRTDTTTTAASSSTNPQT
jgi:CRP-like cAMP-binding protein